jgi:hypothetical protein
VVARLAALHLSDAARSRVAYLLKCDSDVKSVANAMAEVSTWPDTIRKQEPQTGPWHYIDIALTDPRSAIGERCPNGDCVTVKIVELRDKLKNQEPDPHWGALEQLKFLIHFVGDLHQPLHCADDADKGGNCISTESFHSKNLHSLWDFGLVEAIDGNERHFTDQLERAYEAQSQSKKRSWKNGTVEDWTWQAHLLAIEKIYSALHIPVEPPQIVEQCENAPAEIRNFIVNPGAHYLEAVAPVIRTQLTRAGIRLARLLDEIWP